MSSNKLIYDKCAYKNRLLESVGASNYMFYNGKFENKKKAMVEFGLVGGNNVSHYRGNMTDLESDLRGQTRLQSLCDSKKYHPKCIENCNGKTGLPCGSQPCSLLLKNQRTIKFINYKNK